jgi:hypothetical protein
MMRTLLNIVAVFSCMVALCAPVMHAQQQSQDQGQQQAPDQTQQQTAPDQGQTQPTQATAPIPAYRSPLAGAADNGEDTDTEPTPDTTPITGVQNFSLEGASTRSYWQPRFDVSSTFDSNPAENVGGSSSWGTWFSLSGGVDVHRNSGNSNFTLSYLGGGTFSNNSGVNNGVVQALDFSEKLSFRRWALSFFDQLNYLPESSAGFNGLGGVGLPGSGTPGLGVGFTPGQSLLTGQGQNLGNSFYTEVDASLSARSSFTFVGGYSLLHYFDSDLFNYGTATFRTGYNYQVDRKNTIGLSYTFGKYIYSNSDQSITTHTVQGSYGRRVTGRLALQISTGVQVALFQTPISTGTGSSGDGGSGSTPLGPTTAVFWTLSSSVQYALRRTDFGLSYYHGLEGGSGALAGSLTDIVSGSVSRQMSRTFSSGISGGFSRNQGLAVGTSTPTNQTYDYWYGGGNFSHPIGRSLGLTVTYQLQYQTSNSNFCIGTTCGTSVIRNMISVGIGWHERPLLF